MTNDLDEAEEFASERLQIDRETGNRFFESGSLLILGVVATRRGCLADAEGLHFEALRLIREVATGADLDMGLPAVLLFLSELRIAQGQTMTAAEWLGFVLSHQTLLWPDHRRIIRFYAERLLDDLSDQVPPEELAAAVERGKELILEDVINDLQPTL